MDKLPVKTLSIRLKDRHAPRLRRMTRDVNQVWNYTNALSHRAIRERGLFMSAYDMQKFTAGYTHMSAINAGTIDSVVAEYATRRKQFKKAKLNFRSSFGARRALGWIPFKKAGLKRVEEGFKYDGYVYKPLDKSFDLDAVELLAGNFAEDACGNWYINISVRYTPKAVSGTKAVGIDLGCKSTADDSNGAGIAGRWFRKHEKRLAIAQRAAPKTRAEVVNLFDQQIKKAEKNGHTRKAEKLRVQKKARLAKAPATKKRSKVSAIHRNIRNARVDELHKYSRKLVNENAAIFVGNVSSTKLVKTKMAKSVLDAGWGQFKTMLKYKSDHAGIVFKEVNEAYTTQACSSCGVISDSSPKGRAGLVIRHWSCAACGASHDRDVNAAINIKNIGLGTL